jgi:hypothetical protein
MIFNKDISSIVRSIFRRSQVKSGQSGEQKAKVAQQLSDPFGQEGKADAVAFAFDNFEPMKA